MHLRLRRWEARRAWAGRALIALTFPLAYLLIMFASGQHAPSTAARVVIWLWGAAMTAAAVCGEAIWRNRLRLERILEEQSAEPRS
jgi:peptidoglycan/LPS O-acetylase OafA/YrhL